ncbi:hypothetical protein O206_19115 [Ochrobactrum sp. EGD-AQ16]|nr:hypothetical protein O206_19115 [Ochrobactrum sp. EGD-AQ16]
MFDARAIWTGKNINSIARDNAKNFVHFGWLGRLGTTAIASNTQNRHT